MEIIENFQANFSMVPGCTTLVFLRKYKNLFFFFFARRQTVCVQACLHWKWPSSHEKSYDAICNNKYYDRIIHAYVHALNQNVCRTVSVVPWSSHFFVVTGSHFPRQLWFWHPKSFEKRSVCACVGARTLTHHRWDEPLVLSHLIKNPNFLWSRALKIAR